MQIRDYMTKLFDAFGDVEEVTREMLLEQAELIHTISDKCQSTGLFLDSQVRFNQFVQEIEADDKVEDRLLHAWCWGNGPNSEGSNILSHGWGCDFDNASGRQIPATG
ncbi:hypothetical protein [Enterobacter cloacae complex sp. 304I2]|uniref:hypothetical protein n=1 Tax=Enterobacter cloacae complex sp. 304I2 TaxID=3395829 RepID=UPI003CEB90BD